MEKRYLDTSHPEEVVITFREHKIFLMIVDSCHERHIEHLAVLKTRRDDQRCQEIFQRTENIPEIQLL